MREPFTKPYTRRERLSIRYSLKRYDVQQFFREGIWRRVAWRLPHGLAYWTMIRVFGHAWAEAGNKTPNELTYEDVSKAWEAKHAKPARP